MAVPRREVIGFPGPAPERPARSTRPRWVRRLVALSGGLLVAAPLCVGTAAGTAPATAAAAMSARLAGDATRGAATVTFQPIRELWDTDRVARHRDVASACRDDASTLAIVTCDEDRTENLDVEIDAVRERALRSAPTTAAKEAVNRDDEAWLANRLPVCKAGYPVQGGGTIVQILVASCETAVSSSRLDAVEGRPVPTAELTATDDVAPEATEYATTASGARIGAVDSQGDQTGGVVISWVIIGGYRGFVVDPASFTYVDGSFVDPGVVDGHPTGHRVAPGVEYVLGIDYSRLGDDPDASLRRGRFEYRSGTAVVGAWK